MRPSRILLAAATLLGLASCSYSFRNPVEDLAPGEVGGRTVAGASVVLDGVAISVKGGTLDARSRANGRFALLPLPVGRHTLVFRKGTDRALQRVVDIDLAWDGQPQGVWLGDVELPAAVALQGEVGLPGGALLGDDGVVVDEISGAAAAVALSADRKSGTFLLTGLAVGKHRIRVAASDASGTAYVAGPLDVTFARSDAGAVKTLARLPLRRPTAASAPVTVRVGLIGSVPGVSLSDFTVLLTSTSTGATSDVPARVGADGVVKVQLPEGPWTVRLAVPSQATNVTAPGPVSFVAAAGATVDLGTIYAITDAALLRAEYACHTDPDCAPSGHCSGGSCVNWTPPATAPASVPFCDASLLTEGTCQPGLVGVPPPYRACVQQGAACAVLTCGACCTPDGAATLCAKPGGVEGCPAAGYAVLGQVTGAVTGGVQVSLVGSTDGGTFVELVATTSASGLYAFDPVQNGTYDLSPYLGTYTFTPPSRTVRVRGGDVAAPSFLATSPTAGTGSISGRVTGAVSGGVQIMALGRVTFETFATTDANGSYTLSGLAPDTYDVSAYLTGYSFTPRSRTVVVTTGAVTGQDFLATQTTGAGTISGAITGAPGQAIVKIVGSTDKAIVMTVNGSYSLPNLATNQRYTITPELTGVSFSPPDRTVDLVGNATGQDFTATPTGVGGTVCTTGGFCWRNPLPSGQDVQGIWAASASDAWFVGAYGTLHWDGTSFTGVPGLTGLQAVRGSAANDVWAVGGSTIEHWDGTAWTPFLPDSGGGAAPTLHDVWAPAPNDAWAVGASGNAQRWDGSLWRAVPTGVAEDLNAVWGSAANDVWAGGLSAGAIAHWDGAAWTTMTIPVQQPVYGLWGSAANDVWAVGFFPGILHWDGAAWTTVPASNPLLYRVWGSAANDVWAVGVGATMMHWDGVSWTAVNAGSSSAFFYALAGSSATDVWAGSLMAAYTTHGLMHWDGTSWLDRSSGPQANMAAVFGFSPTDVMVVWNDTDLPASAYQRWNGTSWSSGMVSGLPTHALWGASSTDAWAVGDQGHIVHFTGSFFGAPVAAPVTATLRSVWGSSSSDVWAVGDGGTIAHWDGAVWTSVHSGVTGNLSGVWAATSSDAWAVGTDDTGAYPLVLHWDGASWTTTATPAAAPLLGVWGSGGGDVWAVGYGEAIHWTGSTWTPQPLPGSIYQAVSGTGPTAAWAVGYAGQVARWDGTAWTSVDMTGFVASWPLSSVWAAGNGDVWAVGMQGTILRSP